MGALHFRAKYFLKIVVIVGFIAQHKGTRDYARHRCEWLFPRCQINSRGTDFLDIDSAPVMARLVVAAYTRTCPRVEQLAKSDKISRCLLSCART
jgi:hypothetical protein